MTKIRAEARSWLMAIRGATPGLALPTTGANSIYSYDMSVEEQSEKVVIMQDDLLPGECRPSQIYNQRLAWKFNSYMAGSGTAGTPDAGLSPLIRACGMAETIATTPTAKVTYTIASLDTAGDFVDLLAWVGGDRFYGTDARGTFSIELAAGAFPYYGWEFTSLYSKPTQAAYPAAPTFTAQTDPKVVSSINTPTVTIGGVTHCLNKFSMALGNSVITSDDAGCAQKPEVTNRVVTASFTVRRTAYADFDYWLKYASREELAMQIVHGPAGARTTINLPKIVLNTPAMEGVNDLSYRTFEVQVLHTVGTLDELNIVCD